MNAQERKGIAHFSGYESNLSFTYIKTAIYYHSILSEPTKANAVSRSVF